MKLFKLYIVLSVFVGVSSFGVHKFYTSISKIEFVSKKKSVQITSRIFIDDITDAMEKKYHKKIFLASNKETSGDVELLKKYLSEKFSIKINGQTKTMIFVNKELEDNTLICYLKINDVVKIQSMEVENTVLMETHSEQQNKIQTMINGKKRDLLLTSDNVKGIIKL